MQVVILAGGYGTRLGSLTSDQPKPMVTVGRYPIILQLINHFYSYGLRSFIICLGYKEDIIKNYFLNLNYLNNDLLISSGNVSNLSNNSQNLFPEAEFILASTGLNSMTGKRLYNIKDYIKPSSPFFVTYGDGLSSIDLNKLTNFHNTHSGIATVTSVHPSARFGEVVFDESGLVSSFKEKPSVDSSWINGGFFIFNSDIFNYIDPEVNQMLEKDPLENLTKDKKLYTYKHNGYWRCMDTPRDRSAITEDIETGLYPSALF